MVSKEDGKKQSKQSKRLKISSEVKKQSNIAAEGVQTDVVRVKARRGQATDSHSLAERARREKISVRMKLLQSLVPGCDRITGKAHILDEIINYVQLLQNQVEYLAAKLAFVDVMLYDSELMSPSANPCASEPQRLCCSGPQLASVPEYSSIQFRSMADAAPITSASPLLTEDQKAGLISQDGENLLLDMNNQYFEDIVKQPGAGLDNPCTF